MNDANASGRSFFSKKESPKTGIAFALSRGMQIIKQNLESGVNQTMISRRSNEHSSEAGFGVIELAMVVGTAAIIATMSAVIFARASGQYQIRQKAQNLAWQIERARSLAIKQNRTLTLGFSSQNKVLGITSGCDCPEAKQELPSFNLPTDITLSSYPAMTINGNGTIQTTSGSITMTDAKGRQQIINIANSGRVTIADKESATSAH